MSDAIEKYRKVWKKFRIKMDDLEKRRTETLAKISQKLNRQQIEFLQKELKDHD